MYSKLASSVGVVSITSLAIEPSTLGPGQSEIRVFATLNNTGRINITQFAISLYRPDRTMYADIIMSRINDSDRWEGTYTFPADLPDMVLSNFNVASIWFGNDGFMNLPSTPLVSVTLQRGISVQPTNQGGTPQEQCNLSLTFTGPVTIDCASLSNSQQCQTRITVSGPVTINCARGNPPSSP